MRSEKYPIIISTRKALDTVLDSRWSVIYVDEKLYTKILGQIDGIMVKAGYVAAEKTGKHGVFYLRSGGDDAFDPNIHEIYDPMGIL